MSNLDDFAKTARCHICGCAFNYGYEGNPQTWNGTTRLKDCFLCNEATCEGHALGIWDSDTLYKLCASCRERHHIPDKQFQDWARAAIVRILAEGQTAHDCPRCGRRTPVAEVFPGHMFCSGCKAFVCPGCIVPSQERPPDSATRQRESFHECVCTVCDRKYLRLAEAAERTHLLFQDVSKTYLETCVSCKNEFRLTEKDFSRWERDRQDVFTIPCEICGQSVCHRCYSIAEVNRTQYYSCRDCKSTHRKPSTGMMLRRLLKNWLNATGQRKVPMR